MLSQFTFITQTLQKTMPTLTITIPDSIEDIPNSLTQLRKQLAAVNAQRDGILAAIKSIQKFCTHPNMNHSRDIDGGISSHCHVCGYRD